MNFLVSKLSGLRVLCGETINNCLPIHKLFQQDTEQNLDEDGQQRQAQDEGFQQSSIERQNNKQDVKVEEDEEEESKHFNESTKNSYTNSKSEYEMQHNNFVDKDEYDVPFDAVNNMSNQNQNIFEAPVNVVNTQPKASKKPMLGMIDEDKIQKVEKNDPVDEVDYFSQMNMGTVSVDNNTKAAAKTVKKASKKKVQEVKPDDLFQDQQQVQSQFNKINDDIAAEEIEGAAWGANDDDIDL
ncbi:hypothetical protein TTHERM_00318710 (macronuclear) [Tetrahymena thermophila SB210]|uniref:Uncharacterized protein n=1 Tax=Tetrahymena thermophila (strain SB210) TaxID=312017 RepID=I7M2S5_TETTS|nr:hypothetical protein TTHERM_00318710 [Tetrahymena thermophila SB210]EAS01208.1 hypothetical protein TTHERM_00318710 [Tetrahymena thermophila SB210]|eukprot:XP_001021453.1 hypothetical protein TTHERM_00318710 [Tetrahymena thermophila SB210]